MSLDTIPGGVCVYLLTGETCAYLCSMIELTRAGSYLEGGHLLRIPAVVEALIDQNFLATFLAFLVGNLLIEKQKDERRATEL